MIQQRTFRYSYKAACVYLCIFAAMLLLNFTMKNFEPFSLPLFAGALACGLHPFILAGLYILAGGLSFFTGFMPFLLFVIQGVFLGAIFFIYRRLGKNMKAEFALYALIALALYFWLFGKYIYADYIKAAILSAVLFLLCLLFLGAMRCLFFRAGRKKLAPEELIFCAAAVTATGIGLYNCAGSYAYESMALLALLLSCALLRNAKAVFCALVLGLAPAICQSVAAGEPLLTQIAAMCLYAAVVLLLLPSGKLPASLALFICNMVLRYFTDFSAQGTAPLTESAFYLTMLVPLIPCFIFAVLPESWLSRGAQTLRKYSEKRLTRTSIDKNRAEVGQKLFEISAAFREIENAFSALDTQPQSEQAAQALVAEEVRREVCSQCEKAATCDQKTGSSLEKLTAIGCQKGKANLIDMPAALTAECPNPSALLFSLNRALSDYRRRILDEENAAAGRALFAEQAHALADMLKNLAVSQSAPTGAHSESERALRLALAKIGIACDEILVLGELPEIYLTVSGNPAQKRICRAAENALGMPFSLSAKRSIAQDKTVLLLHPTPRFDAAFGVASATKEGETDCGDTTSVQRIDERSFLCALADGMGSGTYARRVSDCALNLVESLYRAGMAGDTVLSTVNRLLSFNREESFACVDIATVNLDTGRADIVKIGSPLSFLLTQGKAEILESDSLPLGILEGVRPTTLSRNLADGDVLVFLSDGITAAFGSSADIADYLCRQPAANPQSLADKFLKEALERCGRAEDDMTVLAIRLFRRTPEK